MNFGMVDRHRVVDVLKCILFYDWFGLIGRLVVAVNTLLFFSMLIPGPEPERTLLKLLSFLSRFSRKPGIPEDQSQKEEEKKP